MAIEMDKWRNAQENKEAAQQIVKLILKLIGDDPNREGLKDTPRRVAKSWLELYSGYDSEPPEIKWFSSDADEMVIVRNIEFYSMCEHHMLPFFGYATVAYVPQGEVIGLSKVARIVDYYARRLQIQEQLTVQIGKFFEERVAGVAVSLKAQHLCMTMRGVKQHKPEMQTNYLTGIFKESDIARKEFLQAL